MREIFSVFVYIRYVFRIYFPILISTIDFMDTVKSRENVTTDREQYQFDVIVIGSGPGGRYVKVGLDRIDVLCIELI